MFALMAALASSGSGLDPLVAELPSGLVGLWAMDQYVESPRPAVPNLVSTVPLSANLFGMSRRNFNNTQLWNKTTTTIVDEAVADPNGLVQASTAAGTGIWKIFPIAASSNIPAGTYTIACSVKRNDSTDQIFAFSSDNVSTKSSVKTATADWQRFSYTATIGAPASIDRWSICSADGTTAANLQICDLELYAGSADLGPQRLAGHLYLGRTAVNNVPTYADGVIDFSGGKHGFIQFPDTVTLQNLTAVAIGEKVVDGVSPANQGFLSRVKLFTNFTSYFEHTGLPMSPGGLLYVGGMLNMYNLFGQGYHMFTQRTNTVGTRTDMFLDTCKVFQRSVTPPSFDGRDLSVSFVSSATLTANYKIAAIALWNRSLSDAEIR